MQHQHAISILLFTSFVLGSAHAELPAPTKPALNSQAPKMIATPIKPIKSVTQVQATGPGTQTEDDIYVGTKRQVQGVNTPGAVLQLKPTATTSPNTGKNAGQKNARTGGDDEDLEELEVERRKVEGVNMPNTGAPQLRPGAGTSPNTGRSASKP